MTIRLGIDVGAVSVKTALMMPSDRAEAVLGLLSPAYRRLESPDGEPNTLVVGSYRRTRGQPLETVRELLRELLERLGGLIGRRWL